MNSGRSRTMSEAPWRRAAASDQDDEGQDDPVRLPYFQACLFATTLEDIMMQLRILDECNSETRISKVTSDMTALRARKYGVAEKAAKDELDDINVNNLHCLEYKLDKLQRDRKFVLQVLTETYLNLSRERNFQALVEHVDNTEAKYANLSRLTEEELKNKVLRRELSRQLRQQRVRVKSATYDTDTDIQRLKSNLEEMLEKVEEWMSKYDKDIENMDLKIQLKKNEHEHTCDRRRQLELTLEKHAELIKDWVAFKEEREALRQYREKMTEAAVAVQAWWRGLLVRLQLGPYKVAKRRGPANKTDEKAGKKKK